MTARRLWWGLFSCLLALGCRGDRSAPQRHEAAGAQAAASKKSPPSTLSAIVPDDSGPYYPSLARTKGDGAADVALLADTDGCGNCHADAFRQWASSAHAHASFDNPWYRSVVDEVRAQVGEKASRHCGGCHDPLLLLSGKMDHEIRTDDKTAVQGVTCLVCHGVVQTRPDGNASYTLASDPVPVPVAGDPASVERHRARVAPSPLRTAALCGSCHRGSLGEDTGLAHHLTGIEEPGPWRASPWAGSHGRYLEDAPKRECRDCHMPEGPAPLGDAGAHGGKLRSHRFVGAHTAMAAGLHDDAQLEAMRRNLASAATLDVPAVWQDGAMLATSDARAANLMAGERVAFDVVIRNTGVGHQFPGGVKDMQDTWLELVVHDANGRDVAEAGTNHEEHEDPSAFVMRALVVDRDGVPEARHVVNHFGSVAYDHTAAPFDARVVRYAWTVPRDAVGPLRIDARLRHRRHREEARLFACESTRSARGRSFARTAAATRVPAPDACQAEPVTDVASVSIVLGAPHPERSTWSRLYDHALGLSSDVQERLGAARTSVAAALSALDRDGGGDDTIAARARLFTLDGRIAARQGRLEEAIERAKRAEDLAGAQPAIDRVRADAEMQVWHWRDAAASLARVTEKAPGDTGAWRDLARARMSANDPGGALDAALSGLKLQPRDEGLLRCETLSLEALESPDAAKARAAFLRYREADETTSRRIACDQRVPNCARDRAVVVTVELRAPFLAPHAATTQRAIGVIGPG